MAIVNYIYRRQRTAGPGLPGWTFSHTEKRLKI